MDREAIERMDTRSAFTVQIESATVEGDVRRIKGYANTFGVMRSGRLIHPAAVEAWLEANPAAMSKLLAQHGLVAHTFATIGKVDVLKVQRSKGLYFEAVLAKGTQLAEDAWTLLSQKMLDAVSIGWNPKQARWVNADDKDIDPWIAKELKRSGQRECYAYFALELLEISVVDIGDDAGAKLAASLLDGDQFAERFKGWVRDALGETRTATLEKTATPADDIVQRAVTAAAEAARQTTEAIIKDFAEQYSTQVAELIANLDGQSAAYRDDFPAAHAADGDGEGAAADPPDASLTNESAGTAELRARLARVRERVG